MTDLLQPNAASQVECAKEMQLRIERLSKDGRLSDDVKLLLIGEMNALVQNLDITIGDLQELDNLLGQSFVAAKREVIELAVFGCIESELNEDGVA